MKFSTTYIATAVSVLVFVLPVLGIQIIDEGSLAKSITEIVGVIAVAYTFYGRYKAGGIDAFGLRLK